MVLKPIIYEIIVFMVGFYPDSIKSNLYSATSLKRDIALSELFSQPQ